MNDDYNNDYDFEDEFDFDEEEIDLPEDVIYLNEGADAYNKKDYEKVISLYEKSASLGNVTALSNLGYCYYYGRSIPVDKEKAKSYWEEAAIFGDIPAVYKLGDMYRNGDLPKRIEYSHKLYRRAFEMALNDLDNYYVAPDAMLRMMKYYPDELGEYGDKLAISLKCIQGIKKRIAEGDPYSQKVLKDAKECLLKIIDE